MKDGEVVYHGPAVRQNTEREMTRLHDVYTYISDDFKRMSCF